MHEHPLQMDAHVYSKRVLSLTKHRSNIMQMESNEQIQNLHGQYGFKQQKDLIQL